MKSSNAKYYLESAHHYARELSIAIELLRDHVVDWGKCDGIHGDECCSDSKARAFLARHGILVEGPSK